MRTSWFGSNSVSGLFLYLLFVVCTILAVMPRQLFAQATIATGSIQGTITDPSGAVVSGAKITVVNKATGRTLNLTVSSAGTYSSGALLPGDYTVRVEAQGFQTVELPLTVQVGQVTPGNIKLAVGQASQVVQVQASANRVNTEQATVQGVMTPQQIENLPINGRNFLDLAQLEPGVQIQDGGNFDPTKNGFSSISFGGRFGRTARIEVDGLDISDETVGTTTQNIPQSAIQEFQISQSSLDLSTELTSSGAVNVVTRSGTNSYHGEGFYLFRDSNSDLAARLPGGFTDFQRHQYGSRFGGPIIKNKLFFFVDGERILQHFTANVLSGGQFTPLSGTFASPFKEKQAIGRVDYQVKPDNYHMFFRYSFDQLLNVASFIPNSFQPFANNNRTKVYAGGLDFTTGSYIHSFRLGYTKFVNQITDAVTGSTIFNPAPQLELAIGNDPFCLTGGANLFCSGPNFLAPQETLQTDKQIKYDGSRTLGRHIFRYGLGYNEIAGGGFAKFLAIAPAVSSVATATPIGSFAGGASNPLNYPVQNVFLANGQGFSSEKGAFDLPAGGLGPDSRVDAYLGDSWKLRPNVTVTYGVRYVRDTGRTDADIKSIPCTQLAPGLASALASGGTPCTGNILDLFGPGLGNKVRQPDNNVAPQLGVAWDPFNDGKTSIRAGIGLFYENSVFNNNLFDRPARLQQGLFLGFQPACLGGTPVSYTLPGTSTTVNPNVCGQAIGTAAPEIAALQQQFQAATLAAGPAVNSVFIGNTLTSSAGTTGTNLFAPNYKTPRSVQINVGIQREIAKGTVVSADYVRNVATHALLAVDTNHVGDARFLNVSNARAAIAATNSAFGCGSSTGAVAIDCAIAAGAKMTDYAANGLDSGNVFCGGFPCSSVGLPGAAFPGANQNLGTNQMLFPVGRSVYNGLQVKLTQTVNNPLPYVKGMNLQVSYALSRYEATARDTDFINNATDFINPVRFFGPNGLDRTHQLSFGGTFDFPFNIRISTIAHFYSALPTTLTIPTTGNPGDIFLSDVTGDGTVGDVLPGTNIGSFGRNVQPSQLNDVLNNYNNTQAFTATPAGQALIGAGLFTVPQLQSLGGVKQPIKLAPLGQQGQDALRAFDLRFSWLYKLNKLKETFTIEPSVQIFNLFNFANFDLPSSPLSGVLDGNPQSVNGTTYNQRVTDRVGLGSGVFGLGSPRVLEFGMRVAF